MIDYETPFVPARAKQARELRGLSLALAALHLGCEAAHLRQIEKGTVPIRVGIVERMEAVYRVPVGFLGKPMSASAGAFATDPQALRSMRRLACAVTMGDVDETVPLITTIPEGSY